MALIGQEYTVIMNLIQNKNCPQDILLDLSQNHYNNGYLIRCYVASHANSPKEALLDLSKDEHPEVRINVAKNRNCPKDILLSLLKDKSIYVRTRAAETLQFLDLQSKLDMKINKNN